MFAPVSEALIDDAEIARGHSVLDVATGPGEPALRIAELVGSNGEVVGIDPVAGMIEASRRAAERLSLNNARFETAAADSLPFPDDRFDAVVSRFGVMFFASPVAAASEMLRVPKPGKKMAFASHRCRGRCCKSCGAPVSLFHRRTALSRGLLESPNGDVRQAPGTSRHTATR